MKLSRSLRIALALLSTMRCPRALSAEVLRIASEADLLRLKKIARAHRSSPGDAEDIAFLEARRKKRR